MRVQIGRWFVVGVAFYCCGPCFGWQAKASSFSSPAEREFDRVRSNPLELRAFLERMPKGGDLHLHISGAVYAESFIRQAADDNLCIDLADLSVVSNVGTTRSIPPKPVCPEKSVTAASAFTDQALYDSLINAFSMRSFIPSAGVSAHDHFFASFNRFIRISPPKHLGEWLDEVSRRASSQNEQYLEIMHTPDFGGAAKLGLELGWSGDLAQTRESLLSKGLRENVKVDREELDKAESERAGFQHCSENTKNPACDVKIRYLFQVLRGFPPEQVFAQTLLGFELASVDPRVVGINFVMAEDWYMPMHEYHRQMEMLRYLHSVYPKVYISLHAGELVPGLVPPDGLQFHIREAVELAGAERIGHGVDVMYEKDAHQLLNEMAQKGIAVEINLTSNDVILGVRGKDSPLPVYRRAGVPIALCTDDEGVSRIDLTHEYVRAVQEFGFTYADLKNAARNSLEHSFLPGLGIWQDSRSLTRLAMNCAGVTPGAAQAPKPCLAWIEASEKAHSEWDLETRFRSFETNSH